MITDAGLTCPNCSSELFADDEFCERCGAAVAAARDLAHAEVDLGSIAGVTDVGLTHLRNEDAMFVDVDRQAGRTRRVAVVCDGVSTSAAPQIAARAAAELIGEGLRAGKALVDAIAVADELVSSLGWSRVPGRSAPSCTAVAAVVDDREVRVAWAGDSRAYWIDSKQVVRLTTDHSWAQEQVTAESMTSDEAMADPRAHMITRWLGDDGLADGAAEANFEPRNAGCVILCSDGLWGLVDVDVLHHLYISFATAGGSALSLAQALVARALALGGSDNVTVVVITVSTPPVAGVDEPGSEPVDDTREIDR